MVRCLFRSFAHFENWAVYLPSVEFESPPQIFSTKLCQMQCSQIPPRPVLACLLIFHRQGGFVWVKSSLFRRCAFEVTAELLAEPEITDFLVEVL